MKFRFEFEVNKLSGPIHHRHKLLLVGSCFTENIGEKLDRYKFTTQQNPHGILFNPVSVAEALTDYIENRQFVESDLFFYNEAWHSWKHHSRFSAPVASESLQKINTSISGTHAYLKQADYLFLTLGSAWVYTLTGKAANAKVGDIAANNHKAPSDWFHRKLMTTEEVLHVLDTVLHRLLQFNPKLKIIFTISPVRHLREGAVDNNRSKAVLISAVHWLVNKFDGLYYFPAYELVIDDLRDYRFYAEDLVHPNYFATQYVWEKFVNACTDENTQALMNELHSIYLAYKHKPFNPDSDGHRKFMYSHCQKVLRLKADHPYLNLEDELSHFREK